MNIMYMGQKPIGEICFKHIIDMKDNRLNVSAVVSNQNTDTWWRTNNIYQYAINHKIYFIDNRKRNTDIIKKTIVENHIDCIISVGHNWIVSEEILELVGYNAVNLHLAKLPQYQGNYTYNHAILNNEKEYGVTLHWMGKEVDEGNYLFMKTFPIEDDDTAYSLYMKSLEKGKEVFAAYLHILLDGGDMPKCAMVGNRCFYSKNSLDGLREIKNCADVEEIKRKSRAFYFPPFENAYFVIDETKYYVVPEIKSGYEIKNYSNNKCIGENCI